LAWPRPLRDLTEIRRLPAVTRDHLLGGIENHLPALVFFFFTGCGADQF
jgi:hypothetical protein